MLPFVVQCETCQAKFQVKHEKVVGQIHACPKCGAMMLLAPPTADAAGEPAPTTAEETAIDAPPALSPVESRGQSIALAIAGGGMACVLAATAVALMWRGDDEPTVAANEPVSEAAIEQPKNPPPAESTEPTPPEPSIDLPPQPPIETPPPLPDMPAAAAAENEPEAVEPEPGPQPAVSPPSEPPLTDPMVNAEDDAIDPLDFDPASADLILVKGPKQSEPPPDAEEAPRPDPTALLDQRLADQRATVVDDRLADRAESLRAWAKLAPTGSPPPEPTPADEALATVLPEIELIDYPLLDAVELVGKLAGAPITINPTALHAAGVNPTQRISIQGRDQPIGELINRAIKRESIACVAMGGHLVIVHQGEKTPPTGGDANLPQLADPITFAFVTETRLDRVVDHWRQRLGVPVLVDWASLAEVDLHPGAKLTAAVHDVPWREALDRVLGDIGLAWRVVEPGVIQVTVQ